MFNILIYAVIKLLAPTALFRSLAAITARSLYTVNKNRIRETIPLQVTFNVKSVPCPVLNLESLSCPCSSNETRS